MNGDGKSGGVFKIWVHNGGAGPTIVDLPPGIHTVGRNSENSLVVDNPTVSGRHCELEVDRKGGLLVRDLASSNGTRVNGRSVTTASLTLGDVLKIGEVVLTLEQDTEPEEAAEARSGAPPPGALSTPFLGRIPSALAYPCRPELLSVIVAVAALEWIMSLFPGPFAYVGMIAGLAVGAFVFLTFCATVESAAKGIDEIPAMTPSMGDFGDVKDRLLGCVFLSALCFGPFAALRHWEGVPSWVPYSLLATGLLYFPMALLMFLLTDDLAFANPINVALSIGRAPLGYAVVVLCLAPLLAGSILPDPGASARSAPGWIASLKRVLVSAFELYWGFAWARILGLFHRYHQRAMGW